MRNPVPLAERDSRLRTGLDLASGRVPGFLFGGGVGGRVPVFRFTSVTLPYLESHLVYLMENGYRTLSYAEFVDIMLERRKPSESSVLLTFDNGWGSLWTVAAPLLRRYGMRATAHIIPGRVPELPAVRPVWRQPGHDPDIDHSDNPFCSWTELKSLAEEGRIDIQSNSWSHAMVFSGDKFLKLIVPETRMPLLSWPVVSDPGEPLRRLSSSNVFHPLLPTRSRLSDAFKHDVDPSVVRRIHGDPDAAPYVFRQHLLQIETEQERDDAIRYELEQSRRDLEARLGISVRHIAFPWGIRGRVAEGMLSSAGYDTAFVSSPVTRHPFRPGKDPHRLSRLEGRYLRCLPGRRRKLYWRIRPD